MPTYLTLQDTAHRYAISESTLHKWLNREWLTPHKVLVRGHMQYLIDSDELEKLLSERGMLTRTGTTYDDGVLTSRLEQLERRVDELELLIRSLIPEPHYPTAPAKPRPVSEGSLPPGYVSFYAFARLHSMKGGNVSRWLQSNAHYTQTGQWSDEHNHVVNTILSPDGRRAFYLLAKDHATFAACPDCPHAILST